MEKNFTEEDLYSIFENLNKLETKFINEAKLFLQIGQHLHTMDLITSAIINRSIALMKGFITLAKENNYISCVPLIRIQIDNSLRFYAATLVSNYDEFFLHYLKGEHIGNLKDAAGNKMRDTYLVKSFEKLYPGIHKLYKNSSGHIHFSNEHSLIQTTILSEKEGTIETRIGHYDFYSIDKKVDFTYNMLKASEILLDVISSWKFQKLKVESELQ